MCETLVDVVDLILVSLVLYTVPRDDVVVRGLTTWHRVEDDFDDDRFEGVA